MTNTGHIPWYRNIPMAYYVCSLIAMGFGLIKYLSKDIASILPTPVEVKVKSFDHTVTTDNTGLYIVSVIQVILVVALLLIIYFEWKRKTKTGPGIVTLKILINDSLSRLIKGIFCIGISWILLYSWFSFFWASSPVRLFGLDASVAFWVIADTFHVITGFFFFYCFTALENPTKATDNDQAIKKRKNTLLYSILLSLGFLTFSIAGRCGFWDMEKLGPILMSLWVALSMQFFFGKLDSFDLKISRVLLAPLYLYVLLQMIWATIMGFLSAKETVFILLLTLLFKTYFLFLFHSWIRHDKFNRYFRKCAGYKDLSKIAKRRYQLRKLKDNPGGEDVY